MSDATPPAPPPVWLTNPLRRISTWIAGGCAVLGVVVGCLNDAVDVLPEGWRATTRGVAAALVVAGAVGAKLTARLGETGVGPGGNGRDGVWSPLSAYSAVVQAQTMSSRKGPHTGGDLPGAPTPAIPPPEYVHAWDQGRAYPVDTRILADPGEYERLTADAPDNIDRAVLARMVETLPDPADHWFEIAGRRYEIIDGAWRVVDG